MQKRKLARQAALAREATAWARERRISAREPKRISSRDNHGYHASQDFWFASQTGLAREAKFWLREAEFWVHKLVFLGSRGKSVGSRAQTLGSRDNHGYHAS